MKADRNFALARKIRAGDAAARAEMIESNMRLVGFFARKFATPESSDYREYLSSGYVGLIEAVDGYDPESGTLFPTYAKYHIDRHFRIVAWRKASIIHVPYFLGTRPRPGRKEYGAKTRAAGDRARRPMVSLDGVHDFDDRVGGPKPPVEHEEEVSRADLAEKIRGIVATLPERERAVVTLVYLSDPAWKKCDVAERIGCHHTYVNKILDDAYAKLRVRAKGLREAI